MNIGTRIQNYRKQSGLSQEDLAYEIGVSRQTVSKWERDECLPEIDKIMMLCNLFNISTDEMLGRASADSETSSYVDNTNINTIKKQKSGKTLFIVGLISTILSVILTEVWALIDSARSGSWYANKLVYLIKSPLAILFFSALAATTIGLVMLIKWKSTQAKIPKPPIDINTKTKRLGIILIAASITLGIAIFLLSTYTSFFDIRLAGEHSTYLDTSGFFMPFAALMLIGGIIALIIGARNKMRNKESKVKSTELLAKVSKKITIISFIAFAVSLLLSIIFFYVFETNPTIPFNFPLWLTIVLSFMQSISMYALAIGLVMLLISFIKAKKQKA